MNLSEEDKTTITTWVESEYEEYLDDCDDEEEAISIMESDMAANCQLDSTDSNLMESATQHLHEIIDEQ